MRGCVKGHSDLGRGKVAGEPGFEPGLTESESVGLPLTYSPTKLGPPCATCGAVWGAMYKTRPVLATLFYSNHANHAIPAYGNCLVLDCRYTHIADSRDRHIIVVIVSDKFGATTFEVRF